MSNPVLIYTTTYCGYCHAAKKFLNDKNIAFKEVDITNEPDAKQALIEKTKHRTVPQIFINDTFIGGYDDMMALVKTGEFERLLTH